MEKAVVVNRKKRAYILHQQYDKTIFIYPDHHEHHTLSAVEWLNDVTIHHGSSLNGRIEAFHALTGSQQKAAILLSERSLDIYFPLRGLHAKENIWVYYNKLITYHASGSKFTRLIFDKGLEYEVPFDYRTIKSQMQRCKTLIEALQANRLLPLSYVDS